jgi:hypothetical protein
MPQDDDEDGEPPGSSSQDEDGEPPNGDSDDEDGEERKKDRLPRSRIRGPPMEVLR